MRKIAHITAAATTDGPVHLFALCQDGSAWVCIYPTPSGYQGRWTRLDSPPNHDKPTPNHRVKEVGKTLTS